MKQKQVNALGAGLYVHSVCAERLAAVAAASSASRAQRGRAICTTRFVTLRDKDRHDPALIGASPALL